jgi:hypothetical protein
MIHRCHSAKHDSYRKYGAKGIRVCDRWRKSFAEFLRDMGPRPSVRHSIDRIDARGDYEPGNCRWATILEQNRRRSCTKVATINGCTRPLVEWANEYRIPYAALCNRLLRGWTLEKALATPLGKWRRRCGA